jgi:hypothetical protein
VLKNIKVFSGKKIFKEVVMKRNLKLGLILGITLLMLLPVYARAQMGLKLQEGSGIVNVGSTVMNLSANQGETISFLITSSLSNPMFTWLASPNGATTVDTENFTWTSVSAGSYLAVFEGSNGTQAEQLVVMITISSNSTTPTPPTETITVSFLNPPTTGTSGLPVSFTASATSSLNHSLQYNFIWGDGTSTGFVSASAQSHTYSTTATYTYTVIVQAKCPTDNVLAQASTRITISGSGGGGSETGEIGSRTNPIKLDQPMPKNALWYGYHNNYSSEYIIPKGSTRYFEVDPIAYTGKTGETGVIRIAVFNFNQTTNMKNRLIAINKNTGTEKGAASFSSSCAYKTVKYTPPIPPDEKYLIECTETGSKDQRMSVWWEFSSATVADRDF